MSDSTELNREIEIKLDLGSFTNYLKLVGFLGQIEQEDRHINGFFDTEDYRLSKKGWALRVRAESKRGLVTVKSIPTREGVAVIRQEIEAEISRGHALDVINLAKDVMSIDNMVIEHVKQQVGGRSLTRLVMFENVRQRKVFKIADHSYLLEVDKTEYSDGSVDYELELELADTRNLEVIEDKLRRLFHSLDIPFVHQSESKFHRALKKANIFQG
ncbi:MAG: CYTH domain-containing protein [Candidatus Zixiibacteriota bacterium]|nr:MAG: CYTH domain-containing protein [candidate division Zixibacteria bacterium]